MRIGVIGPRDSVEIVLREVKNANIAVECSGLIYQHYSETTELVNTYQTQFDGLLFTGTTPFRYAVKTVRRKVVPWGYIRRSLQILFCALLKAVHEKGDKLNRIIVDSYHSKLVREALALMEIDDKETVILEPPYEPWDEDYEQKVLQFHIDSYNNGGGICLTGLSRIERELKKLGIPVSRLSTTSDVIIEQIQKLLLAYHVAAEREEGVAVVSIGLSFSQEHSLYGKTDLETFLMATKASEVIYSFAQRIDAALETHENYQYRLYAERKVINNEFFSGGDMYLLKDISRQRGVKRVYIGVGYGTNMRQAKYHAELAQSRAIKNDNSCLFFMDEDGKVTGPLVGNPGNDLKAPIDYDVMKMSKDTGIAMERLRTLINVISSNYLDTTTPKELSRLSGLSQNAVNRMLVKLEAAGYLAIVGKDHSAGNGRSSRVVRLLLPITK